MSKKVQIISSELIQGIESVKKVTAPKPKAKRKPKKTTYQLKKERLKREGRTMYTIEVNKNIIHLIAGYAKLQDISVSDLYENMILEYFKKHNPAVHKGIVGKLK